MWGRSHMGDLITDMDGGCVPLLLLPWKGYWVPNDIDIHRNSQNVNLSWVGLVYFLLLRNDLREMRQGTILSYSYFVPTRPRAWEGITNKYCNIYFVIPIHWGRKFIFSSAMGSRKSYLLFGLCLGSLWALDTVSSVQYQYHIIPGCV